jgi:hypothetical protein
MSLHFTLSEHRIYVADSMCCSVVVCSIGEGAILSVSQYYHYSWDSEMNILRTEEGSYCLLGSILHILQRCWHLFKINTIFSLTFTHIINRHIWTYLAHHSQNSDNVSFKDRTNLSDLAPTSKSTLLQDDKCHVMTYIKRATTSVQAHF